MRFAARLRDAAAGLEATLRVRRRVVSELAADLEDLYGAYVAEGLSGPEARRRAERVLAPSEEVLAALSYVHRPLWLRLADRFGEAGRNRVEWTLLVVLTTGFCAAVVVLLLRAGLTPAPAPFVVAIVGLAFGSLLYALGRSMALYLGRRSGNAGYGVDGWVLAASGCAALVLAGLGMLVGLSQVATDLESNPGLQAVRVLRWIREASGLGALGLLVALADGLALLVLRRRISVLADEDRRWDAPLLTVEANATGQTLTRTG